LSTEQLFYACIIPFIMFFGAFAFIMYPLRDTIHPHGAPACISPFVSFFGAPAFTLYRLRKNHPPARLQRACRPERRQAAEPLADRRPAPPALADRLYASAGVRFAGPIAILRNWSFCLFYVMAELWGSVVVSLLFWGFANQACPLPPRASARGALPYAPRCPSEPARAPRARPATTPCSERQPDKS